MTSSEDDTTFTKLFDEALLQYEQNTGKKIDDDAVLRRKVQSTEGMLSAIQDREKKFDKFRKTHSKLWEALRSTMKRVRGFGSLIQSGVSLTPFAPASFVVAAALSLVDVAASITDSYDTLETVFEKIEDITGRVEEYLETCMGMKLRRIVVKLLCTLLETFGESERLIRHGRSIEMIRRISGKESKVLAVLDRLEDLWKSEMGLVIATNYSTGQRTERKVDQIVSLSNEGKNRSEEDADRRTLETLLSVDPEQEMETFHARMDEIRLPDSGDWLFNERVFQAWLEMKFPVLCVIGGPGVGKSYLASRVISYLKSQHGQNKSPTVSNSVAYFYIQEGNQSQQPLSVILKRIVYQITQTYAPYRRHTISVCERPDCLLTPGMIWTNLFLRFFENPRYTPLFIVIDGVDEACLEDQKTLLNLVKPLCDERNNSNVPMIQILLLGRNELEYGISNAWSESRRKPEIIRISPEKTRADIKSFITKGVKEIGLLNRLRQRELEAIKRSRLGLTSDSDRLQRKGLRLIQKFENEIILKLENSADGMFMWAKLMLDEIKNMNKPKLIKDALDKPPQSLRDMLQHIVKRLSVVGGFDKNDFNEILSWVACTKRDLLLGELDLVLKLRDLEESGVPGLEHELKTRFGSFFTLIDKNGGLVDGEDDDEHESVDGGLPDDSTGLSDITLHDEEYDSDEADLEDEDIWGDEKGDPFQETGPPPANFLTTTVKFSHASVGQHFRSEGVYLGIGIQLNSARAHVTYICLLILTDSIQKKHGKPWPTPNLLDYSLEHFLEHLAEVDMKSLKASEPSTYEKISKELSLLFGYGDIAKRMYLEHPDIRKLLGQIFSDNKCSSLIRCWLPENPNPDTPNSAHSKWGRKAKKSARALFKPLARMVAELWLVRGTVYEWWAAIFLHEFMSIDDEGGRQQRMLILDYPLEEILKRIPPERIREVARYWSFKRDSDWHVYVGNALKKADSTEHLLASIQEFQRALRKDGTNWKALAEKAKALDALKRTQEAITDSSRALEIIPEFQTKAKVGMLFILQMSMLDIRDAEGAVEAASKAYDLDPTSDVTIFNKLYTFHKSRKFDKVVEFAKSLTTDFPNDFKGTYLDRILDKYQTAYELIGIAAGATNNLDFARDAYLAAAVSAERRRDTDEVACQKYNLGEFYYRHCSDEDKARDLWQYTIRNYGATRAAARSSLYLGTLYYDRAKNAEGERRDPSSWISELERLLEESVEATSASLNDYSLGAGPGSLLGHWYRIHEKRGQAKVTLKPTLKLGMDGLRDQDPSNDSVAYAALGCALLCYGDRENAAIAYAFTTPRQKSRELQEFEDHQINNASSNSTIEEAQVPSHKKLSESKQLANIKGDADFTRFELMWGCSGRCQHSMVHWRSFHKCEICDGAFCNDCVKLLRNGNLPFRVCDARHPLFKIYPRLEEVRKVDGSFFVKSKGEYISREEWLDMLSEEWLVEELPPHRRPLSPPDQAD